MNFGRINYLSYLLSMYSTRPSSIAKLDNDDAERSSGAVQPLTISFFNIDRYLLAGRGCAFSDVQSFFWRWCGENEIVFIYIVYVQCCPRARTYCTIHIQPCMGGRFLKNPDS